MVALIAIGMWLVLQPALSREKYDYEVRVGATRLQIDVVPGGYRFVAPAKLADLGVLTASEKDEAIKIELQSWNGLPAIERTLMGFFNISSWTNFGWVAVGLLGQCAFFGRMFVQWIVSEKSRKSQVPEIFWWFSLVGGAMLFTYFVWRVDVVGVLGQSTGVVIYARNLRLIHKERRRAIRQKLRGDASAGDEA